MRFASLKPQTHSHGVNSALVARIPKRPPSARVVSFLAGMTIMLLAACNTAGGPLTPTRVLSGPTLAASATVQMFSSEELYGTAVAFGGDGQNNATTAPLPSRDSLPPLIQATAAADGPARIAISLEDGTNVVGDFYVTGDALLRGPGLLLIGGEGAVWGDVPQQARAAGMTVLVMSLRVTPATSDLRSLLTSLSELPTVDPSHLGIVVQGEITDAMFIQCAAEPLCDFAALIGPRDRDALLGIMNLYQPRPLLLVTGDDNAASTTAAVALLSAAPRESVRLISRPTLRPDVLNNDAPLTAEIVAWLQNALAATPPILPTLER